jgi:Ras-related protein Rab-1A
MNNIERVILTLLGNNDVGKTSILRMYADGVFHEIYPTFNSDFKVKSTSVKSKKVKVLIDDLLFHSRRRTLIYKFLGRTNGIIVVYDVTNRSSFEEVDIWMSYINEFATKDACKLIIGNKCDIEDKVVISYDEGKALADRFGVPFIETSAKSGLNIDQAFMQIISEILYRRAFTIQQQEEVSKPWNDKYCILW